MDSLPLDLLAYCLGHVSLSDIRSCWSVCKRFKDAITTKKHFWKRNIEIFLESKGCKQYARHFDPFIIVDKNETLREQVLFLFRNSDLWFRCIKDIKNVVNIDRRSNSMHVLSCVIVNDIPQYVLYESCIGFFNHTYGKQIVLADSGQKLFYNKDELYAIEGMLYNGRKWNGNVIKGKDGYFAHGKGEWIFADGSTLKGEHVAHYGRPVKLVDYEEWREWKRQKK
jgi:hypothetical protein